MSPTLTGTSTFSPESRTLPGPIANTSPWEGFSAAAEKPSQGEVLAIGPGRVLDSGEKVEVPVSVGDTVVFGQYAGSNTIKVDGEELLILSESDLLGTVSK